MKVLFHHIPKTAGTSLINQIKKVTYPSCDIARYDPELNESLIRDKKYKFYHGHFSFDKVKEFKELTSDNFVFTFIRNPLNRVISHYYNRIDKKRVLKELSIVEARTGDPSIAIKRNVYKEDIFKMNFEDFLKSNIKEAKESYFNRHTRYFCEKAIIRVDRKKGLEQAIANIQNFYNSFGLTELYEDSLRTLEGELNLPINALKEGIRKNVNTKGKQRNSKSYQISKKELDLLIKHNQLDIELYQASLEYFLDKNKINYEGLKNTALDTVLFSGPEIK